MTQSINTAFQNRHESDGISYKNKMKDQSKFSHSILGIRSTCESILQSINCDGALQRFQ